MSDDLIERATALLEKALNANAEEQARLERWLKHLEVPATPKRDLRPVKRARPVPYGERPKQVLRGLMKGPGSAGELARRTGMSATGIYPVLKQLLRDDKVTKAGTMYSAAPSEVAKARQETSA